MSHSRFWSHGLRCLKVTQFTAGSLEATLTASASGHGGGESQGSEGVGPEVATLTASASGSSNGGGGQSLGVIGGEGKKAMVAVLRISA